MVDLVAPPMSGHLHPILGIARRLAQDTEVRVISTASAQAEIRAAGLRGHLLLAGHDERIHEATHLAGPVRSRPWRLHAKFRDALVVLERVHAELLELWRDSRPRLVIADFLLPVAGSAAIASRLPWWTTIPSPCAIETPDGPPGYLGGLTPARGQLGGLRDAAGRRAIRVFKRAIHWRHRHTMRRLGFPALYRADGSEATYSPDRVLALSLEALEFPRTYPPAVEFVGPVLYTPPADTPPPPFRDGRQHVLVTLGTHLAWRREAVAAAVQHAARELPSIEFHISDGNRTSQACVSNQNVHRIGFVSYLRDLSRYQAVIHHGGAGVLAHTLAAGAPALVLPADHDQFDHAARLEVAGVGIRVRRLGDLPRLINRLLNDSDLKARCAQLQATILASRAEERVAANVAGAFPVTGVSRP